MEYRYYVHDTKENVGVTEFSSSIHEIFIEALLDAINWFMWESDDTCNHEITFFLGEEKHIITFDFDEEDEMYALIDEKVTYRDTVCDAIKSHF